MCLIVFLISIFCLVNSGSNPLHKNNTNNIIIKNKRVNEERDNSSTTYKLRGSIIQKNARRFRTPTPHLGYEVYWSMPMSTFSGPICGYPCPEMYKEYGEICARNREYNYKTFPNPCEMLIENCEKDMGWIITRLGECFPYWGTSEGTWDLWINKGTLAPELKEKYDKGHTIIDSLQKYKHYVYDY